MKIAILGGSFNPAGIHHLRIVQEVLELNFFDKVIILPCGPRPDKQNTEDIDPVFRAAMLEITFRGFPDNVEIELNDLENNAFTRTVDIERYNLYRGRLPLQQTLLDLDAPRLLIVADETNATARKVRKMLAKFSDPANPNLIVDIGGDGNKLKAIRKYWPLRLPFFGINAGHRGYLQNDIDPANLFLLNGSLVVHHLPLLQVDVTSASGENKLAFIRGFDIAAKHTKIQLPYFQKF